MVLTNTQAVLLDMDGTLVDSDAAVERDRQNWPEGPRDGPSGGSDGPMRTRS